MVMTSPKPGGEAGALQELDYFLWVAVEERNLSQHDRDASVHIHLPNNKDSLVVANLV